MRITSALVIVGVSLAVSACSTTKGPGRDGIPLFSSAPKTDAEVGKLRAQLEQNAKSSGAKAAAEGAVAGAARPGVIVVGSVGSFRELAAEIRSEYYQKSYMVASERWHPGTKPSLSEQEFSDVVAGYTSLTTWNIPGLVARRTISAVLPGDVQKIDFPSKFTAHMFGTTGDLVAARSNDDGAFFVSTVLCKESSPDYSKCAALYERGNYDANTGVEINTDMTQKSDGARIDVTTYKALPKI